MRCYRQQYVYDAVGNILAMIHRGTDPAHPGWTRIYSYSEPSLLEPAKSSNRLTSTSIGSGTQEMYAHDAHGNMTTMPHLPLMRWDYQDQLQATAQQVVNDGGTPEISYYVYDGSGQRVRQVTERQAPPDRRPRTGRNISTWAALSSTVSMTGTAASLHWSVRRCTPWTASSESL